MEKRLETLSVVFIILKVYKDTLLPSALTYRQDRLLCMYLEGYLASTVSAKTQKIIKRKDELPI